MQRKTSPEGIASVHLNNYDRKALATAADYFYLWSSCCRSNCDIEGQVEYELKGQAIQDELRHMAKLDKPDAAEDQAETGG